MCMEDIKISQSEDYSEDELTKKHSTKIILDENNVNKIILFANKSEVILIKLILRSQVNVIPFINLFK